MVAHPKKVLFCNRCGSPYVVNSRFKGTMTVNDEEHYYDITSICLMGCRRTAINSVSLCDDCIEDFLKWSGNAEKFLNRPNPHYTRNYMEGDEVQ